MANDSKNMVDLAANLTIAWLNNPTVRATTEEAKQFLQGMLSILSAFDSQSANPEVAAKDRNLDSEDRKVGAKRKAESIPTKAVVSVRASLASPDRIVSFIDGKPYASLRRHLASHGLTANQYRKRFGLPPDYPMVAPAYSEKRREIAKKRHVRRDGSPKPKGSNSNRTE